MTQTGEPYARRASRDAVSAHHKEARPAGVEAARPECRGLCPPGHSIRSRIKHVAGRCFVDEQTGQSYQFTWRTISTWLYRFKKHSVIALANKTCADKNAYRKVQPNELAEALHKILPGLSHNKTGIIPKSTLYPRLLGKGFFRRSQLSQTSFYRMVRENNLLDTAQCKKLRRSFYTR